MIKPFCPQYKSNQNVSATSPAAYITINRDSDQIRIVNSGSNVAYICTYDSAGTVQVAAATDFAIFPNQTSTISKSEYHDRLSYFSAAGATLSIMTGQGL